MNKRHCLKIAQRIDAGLLEALGQGIEPQRMLADPLYARDVLLVCGALREGDLAALAVRFRIAALAADDERSPKARAPSGFNPSRFFSSLFGPTSSIEEDPDLPQPPPRRWLGRSRETHK